MKERGISLVQKVKQQCACTGTVIHCPRPNRGTLTRAAHAMSTHVLLLMLLVVMFASTAAQAQIWSAPPAITPGSITSPSGDIIIGVDTLPFYFTTTAATDTDMRWQMGPPTYPPDSFNRYRSYKCE